LDFLLERVLCTSIRTRAYQKRRSRPSGVVWSSRCLWRIHPSSDCETSLSWNVWKRNGTFIITIA
jgi:hypothetical protein